MIAGLTSSVLDAVRHHGVSVRGARSAWGQIGAVAAGFKSGLIKISQGGQILPESAQMRRKRRPQSIHGPHEARRDPGLGQSMSRQTDHLQIAVVPALCQPPG